jgi:Zn-dependent peptidase ImmA (M78 family)
MAKTEVDIQPALLRWALEQAPDPEEVRRQVGPPLEAWLSGEKKPSLAQLKKFAKAARVPLGYLFYTAPPVERFPVPFFRTKRSKESAAISPELRELVYIIERRQAWLREFRIESGWKPLPFIGSLSLSEEATEGARRLRAALGLEEGWAQSLRSWKYAFRHLKARAESIGITVIGSSTLDTYTHRPLNPEEFRGFVLVDDYAPFIFINSADSQAAQIFTLAHELAHLWLGQSAAFDLRELAPAQDPIERQCNRIAAEFLVPTQALNAYWHTLPRDADRLQKVAQYFKVSRLVAARRALDLELITYKDFSQIYQASQEARLQKAQKSTIQGNFYANQVLRLGRKFIEAVWQAVRSGRLLYHEAYRLTGLYGASFDRLAAYVTKRNGKSPN